MRRTAAVGLACLLVATPASAEVATPYIRVEGRTMTLFEGPLRADGHTIRSADDTLDRPCDGTNAGRSTIPGPTPTSLAVDGMRLAGADFGANWYAGFDDYFITRFGPDLEGNGAYWGVLVDGTFTQVGGCQIKAPTGSEAMWAYDAFRGRRLLRLDPPGILREPGQPGFAPIPSVTIARNAPLSLTVRSYTGGSSDNPDASQDTRPAQGITIAAVQTADNGFQSLATTGEVTDADGRAELRFATAGWHRVKATADGFIRSNRLDVCVPETGQNSCGALPADATVRDVVPTPMPTPIATPTATPTAEPTATTTPIVTPAATAAPKPTAMRLSTPTITSSGTGVRLQFGVLDPGPGLGSWTVTSTALGIRDAKPTIAARGAQAGTTTFTLVVGREYALAFTASDVAGTVTRTDLGTVIAPIDDRKLRYSGKTTRRGTLTRLARGASTKIKLGAGRPLLQLGTRSSGTIEIAGRRYRAKPGLLRAASRSSAGAVIVKVRSGAIELAGVAAGR